MSAHASPAELYRHGLRLLLDKDTDGWAGLWAEDGVLEFPFAPDDWPRRLEGRDAIAAYLRHYPDHIDLQDFTDVRVHLTAAPETVVIEMRGVGRLVKTGSPYDMNYIVVVTARDGHITACRDYWNPLALRTPGMDFLGGAR